MISFLDSAQLLNSIQRKSLLDIYLKSAYTTEKKRVRTVKEGVRFVRFMRSVMCTDSFFFFAFLFFGRGGGGGVCFFGLRPQKSMDHFLDCGERNYFAS